MFFVETGVWILVKDLPLVHDYFYEGISYVLLRCVSREGPRPTPLEAAELFQCPSQPKLASAPCCWHVGCPLRPWGFPSGSCHWPSWTTSGVCSHRQPSFRNSTTSSLAW